MSGWLLVALWAAAAPPPAAVLRTPLPGALERRIQDQAVDSGWALVPVPGPQGGLPEDLALAEAHAAQAVVSVLGPPEGPLAVTLSDAKTGRRYARQVAPLGSAVVTEEAAAVLIRDSLVALAETGALDWTVQDALPPLEREAALFVAVGGDGLTLHPRVGAAFGLGRAAWRARLALELGFPRRLDLGDAEVTLAQHALRLQAGLRTTWAERLTLEGGLSGGVAMLRRRTTRVNDHLLASPPGTRAAGLAGAYGRLELHLGPMAVWLAGGGELVAGAPLLEVDAQGGAPEARARAWAVQPWGAAGTSVTW